MRLTYDKEADALYIKLTDEKITDSEEIEENIVVDFDIKNKVVGIEITYFVQKYKQDFFPVFKKVEQSVWNFEHKSLPQE